MKGTVARQRHDDGALGNDRRQSQVSTKQTVNEEAVMEGEGRAV